MNKLIQISDGKWVDPDFVESIEAGFNPSIIVDSENSGKREAFVIVRIKGDVLITVPCQTLSLAQYRANQTAEEINSAKASSGNSIRNEVQKAWMEAWEAAGDYPNKPPCQAKWLTSRARAIYQGERP